MAIAEILSTVRNFVSSSSKTNNEFRNESGKNNRNINSAIRDISKMFQSQRAENAENQNSINEVLDITQATSRKTIDNNDLLKQSISLQNEMLGELKQISSSIKDLMQISQGQQGANPQNSGLTNMLGLGAAGIGVAALPGLLNNFFGSNLGGQSTFNEGMFSETASDANEFAGGGNQDTGGGSNGEKLSVAQMVSLAKEAGFSDKEAAIMGAIGAAESSGRTSAHNPNASTGDNSYGLWQINMLGKMGPERRNQFGIENNEELFDPKKNAAAAYEIYKQQGFEAWSVYKSGAHKKYIGTAESSLQEKDDGAAAAPVGSENSPAPGAAAPQSSAMGSGGGVLEKQHRLASIRTQPISDELKSVLSQAAAAAGVDVVVYSGGQPSKASGKGPRTGSTRHDDGNAADIYLTKDGKKLSDTNPEDRAIMAKFVSASVQAGATGVGAGHGYMGSSNIHVGFGKPATWGGAPWIASAASGVYSNSDLQAEGKSGGSAGSSTGGSAGGSGEGYGGSAEGSFFGGISDLFGSALGMLGIGGVDIPSLLSSFFGIPSGAFTGGNDESKESVDDLFSGESEKKISGGLNEDKTSEDPIGVVAGKLQEASLDSMQTKQTEKLNIAENERSSNPPPFISSGTERQASPSFGNFIKDPVSVSAGWGYRTLYAENELLSSNPEMSKDKNRFRGWA
jgi:hypothetical protein